MLKFVGYHFLLILALLSLSACQHSPTAAENKEQLKLYTSVYPIQYIAERIGGPAVNAETLFPPGADAHTFEPSAKDLTRIAEADAFIYLGGNMEAFSTEAAEALQPEEAVFIALADHPELFEAKPAAHEANLHQDRHAHSGHEHGDRDPHIWLDPLRTIAMAEIVKEELTKLAPEQRALFQTNYLSLAEDLRMLDREFEQAVAGKRRDEILVSHAAYGYWEQRYGIEQIAVSGVSNQQEPSQKALISLIEQAKALEMDHIVFERNVSDKVSRVIQREIGAETLTVHNLAVLTKEEIRQGEDYLSLMRENIQVIKQAIR